MDKFIHRENLALFRKRLAEPDIPGDRRKVVLALLEEAQIKGPQPTPVAAGPRLVAPHLGNGDRRDRLIRAEAESAFPETVRPPELNERVTPQWAEHRATARHTSREPEKLGAVVREPAHAQVNKIA